MKEKNGEHPFGDAGQLILLGLFLSVWITDSFFLDLTTRMRPYVPLAVRLGVGGAIMIGAALIARAGHVVVSGRERPGRVIKEGIFRYVRHPLYLASRLFYLSLFHMTFSIASAVVMVFGAIFYTYLANYEEKLMLRRFGSEYEQYMMTTGKFLPRIWKKRQVRTR